MPRTKQDMQRVKESVDADIDPITNLHVLLTRLGAPKRGREQDAQDALVLAMIEVGNALDRIGWTYAESSPWEKQITSFESCAYHETFAVLKTMPWRCVEARDMEPPWARTTEVPLSEALVAIAPAVFMLKSAHFSLADEHDKRRWDAVLAAIAVFETAYAEHTGEAFGLAVAIRALSVER